MINNNRAFYGAWFLVSLVSIWMVYGTMCLIKELRADVPAVQPFFPPSKPQEDLVSAIKTVHIFGSPELSPLTRGEGMQLKGIFLNTPSWKSRALIALTGRAARSYAEGDNLVNGAHVHQISVNEVILVKEGKLIQLELPVKGINFVNSFPNPPLFG